MARGRFAFRLTIHTRANNPGPDLTAGANSS
jgi:hypothetical protein